MTEKRISVLLYKKMSKEATKSGISRIGSGERKKDLHERLFEFAEMVKEFLIIIPSSPEYLNIITRLSKSAGSLSDYNNDEKSVSSKTDFSHDPEISLRYLRESDCWLRITKLHVKEINKADLECLLNESAELKSLLDSIIQKSQ
jgi:four helix bundle protein